MKKYFSLFLLLLLALGLLAGCAGGEESFEQDPTVLDSQQYVSETVYIGSVLPLSGSKQQTGERLRAAQEVALDIINNSHELDWDVAKNAGIVGYGAAPIELEFADAAAGALDASGTPTAQAAQSLIDLGVIALVGGPDSDAAVDIAIRAQKAALSFVSGNASSVALTDGETHQFDSMLHCVSPTPRQETAAMFAYLKSLNLTVDTATSRLGVVYEDSDYGREVLAAFNQLADEQGWDVVLRTPFAADATNVASEVQRIMAAQPDALLHAGQAEQIDQFINTYKTAMFAPKTALVYGSVFQDGRFITTASAAEVSFWGGVSAYPLAAAAPAAATATTAESEAAAALARQQDIYDYINVLYRAKTGVNMDNAALYEFASVIVLAQAIGLTGSTDAQLLAQTLDNTVFDAPYLCANSIDFDENGLNVAAGGNIALLQEGRLVKVF